MMLTPNKKLVDSPFQTLSPINQQPWGKRKSQRKFNKENFSVSPTTHYDLIPEEDSAKLFVWRKKENRDRKRKHDHRAAGSRRNLVEEHRKELEQLKKRRLERDRLREQRMIEKEDIKKMHLAGEFENWEKEEHAFMLRQAKERTKLRLSAGRAQPIDLLFQYKENRRECSWSNYPFNLIARLSTSELGHLLEDVKVYKEIEAESECDYWDDVLNVVEKYIEDSYIFLEGTSRRGGINKAVSCDVSKILSGKSSNQLIILRCQIQEKLASGNIDVSFWECLLENLKFYLSIARLHEMQEHMCQRSVTQTEQHDGSGKYITKQETTDSIHIEKSETCNMTGGPGQMSDDTQQSRIVDVSVTQLQNVNTVTCQTNMTGVSEDLQVTKHYIRRDVDIYEDQYSPKYLKESDLDKDTVVTDPVEDTKRLTLARQKVCEMYNRNQHSDDSSGSDDESSFTNEYKLLQQSYSWDSRYRPRKPRYFNRVVAGFVWNRYNRTHYDIDNPPPKAVRGYKFNLFYPDLIDKTITPVYSITACDNDKGHDIIRFSAGPPYEDIAFQIVRGEWNKSVRRGYRSSFNGRVLELWFHFRHMCYRR